MSASIEEIALTTVSEHTGFRGRKLTTVEALCLKTRGGNIYLKRSAVEGAGNSCSSLPQAPISGRQKKGFPSPISDEPLFI